MEENYNTLELKFFNATLKEIKNLWHEELIKVADNDRFYIGNSPIFYKEITDGEIYDLCLYRLDCINPDKKYMFFYPTKDYDNSLIDDFELSMWAIILQNSTLSEFMSENDIILPFQLHDNTVFSRPRSFILEVTEACKSGDLFRTTLWDDNDELLLSERYFRPDF